MASRRDLLHAYQFMMQRVISAVVVRETDPEQAPLRRGVGAVFAGVMIAVLIAAGFGVYGVFTGIGGNKWRSDGSIIIERETGATYVYSDGSLRPVLNLASARLIAGTPGAEPHRVAGEGLQDIPRSVPVGIAGAPQSLPPPDRVVRDPWTLCSGIVETPSGGLSTVTTLLVGDRVAGGRSLSSAGVLVRDEEDGTPYLIWRNHRYRLAGEDPGRVIRSLFGAQQPVVDVGGAWLNGLPVGQDIGPIGVPRRGRVSDAVPGHKIGDVVYHPVGGGNQYYLVRDDGFAPLTDLQRRILEGQYSIRAQQIVAATANEAPASAALSPSDGETAAPSTPPRLATFSVGAGLSLCAETTNASKAQDLTMIEGSAASKAGVATPLRSPFGTKLADRVHVPPGSVVVVRAMTSQKSQAGALYLVTDHGVRFAVPSTEALAALGYSASDAIRMPAALVQRIPAGPTLDPESALRPVER